MKRSIRELKIYLLDRNPEMYSAWSKYFFDIPNVDIVCADFIGFMRQYKVDCVVSPANGYGLMDGGYDEAITAWFGSELQQRVQRFIMDELYGEQPLCSSIILDTNVDGVKLIHTPTMRFPGIIKDDSVIYHCTRSCLITALKNSVNTIVVPAFGGLTGCVQRDTVARMMRRAYDQLADPPDIIDWKYAKDQRL